MLSQHGLTGRSQEGKENDHTRDAAVEILTPGMTLAAERAFTRTLKPLYNIKNAAGYTWEKWLDGTEWTLKAGEDFTIPTELLRANMYNLARMIGVRVTTSVSKDKSTITVTAMWEDLIQEDKEGELVEEFMRAVKALDITVIQLNVIIPETLTHYSGMMECLKVKMEE